MRTLAIIPSRYGSTRFPGKPLADIAGKPMIQMVYEQARKAFDDVCVATDDYRIIDVVNSFGGIGIITSSSHESGTDRCYEAYLKYISLFPDREIDLIINVQGDEPLISPEQLIELERPFLEDKSIYLGTMAKKIETYEELFSPNVPKVIFDNNKNAIYFSRSTIPYLRGRPQEGWLEHQNYYKHIGLYAYRPHILEKISKLSRTPLEIAESLEQLRWIENGLIIKIVETTHSSMAVDTPEDLLKIVRYIKKDL